MSANQPPDINWNVEHERNNTSLMTFMIAAVMWTTASSVYAQSSTEAVVSPTPVVAPADTASQPNNPDTSKIVIPSTNPSTDNPTPTDKQNGTTVAVAPQTVVPPSTITYRPYLWAENYDTGCRTVENYAGPSSLLQIMVNGKAMDLVSFKAKDGTSDIVIPKTRTRMWAFGRCFDIFEGQIYPVNISPEGKVIWVNSYGWLLSWIKNPDWETSVWWYNWIRKMIIRMNEGKAKIDEWIFTIEAWIWWNVTRLVRIMQEDPQLLQPDSQHAYIATLLQLQLDILSRPWRYDEIYSMWKNEILAFLNQNKELSFLKWDDSDKYRKINDYIIENLYKVGENHSIVAQK